MDLVTDPDTYSPTLDDMGNYIDKIPPFTIKHGIRCPCGSRKDHVYTTYSIFYQHIKTKTHQKWLQDVNLNKRNYYIENEELKTTVQQQRMIIATLEKDLQCNINKLNSLMKKSCNKSVNYLLDLD